MSWVISHLGKSTNLSFKEDQQAALLKISTDISHYQMVASNELANVNSQYSAENELIEQKYDAQLSKLDPSSNDYVRLSLEKSEKLRKLDNQHTSETTRIQNEANRKIKPLEATQEMLEAQIKNSEAQHDTWKESTDHNIEKECAYFSGS